MRVERVGGDFVVRGSIGEWAEVLVGLAVADEELGGVLAEMKKHGGNGGDGVRTARAAVGSVGRCLERLEVGMWAEG